MQPPYAVWGKYEDLLAAFSSGIENEYGYKYEPPPIKSFFRSGAGANEAEFDACIYLERCPPWSPGSGRELDLALWAYEKIEKNPKWVIAKSSVHIHYISVTNSRPRLLQALRYDFLRGGQKDHPLFHLHLTDDKIDVNRLQRAGCSRNLARLHDAIPRTIEPRIPTPDMTLASVLYCIIADHWPKALTRFSEKACGILIGLPELGFEPLRKSLRASPKHFKSSHWYAHSTAGS